MKYIESTPLPDGTYDHTEVRAAWVPGSPIYAKAAFKGLIFEWEKLYLNNPSWYEDQQYRVEVPDTYGIHESSSTPREVKGDAGPAIAEMLLDGIEDRDSRIKELERNLDIVIKSYELCVKYAGIDPRRSTINHARTILNKEPK